MKRDFFEFDSPFYKPLWVRVLILVICFGWGGYELIAGNVFWAILFLAGGVICVWGFFIRKKGDGQ